MQARTDGWVAIQATIVGVAFFLIWLAVDPLPGGATLAAVARPLLARAGIDPANLGILFPLACFIVVASFTLAENVALHSDVRGRDWIAGIAVATVANYIWVWLALVEAWIAPIGQLARGTAQAETWQMALVILAALILNFAPQFVWLTAFQIVAERASFPSLRLDSRRSLLVGAAVVAAAWMLVIGG